MSDVGGEAACWLHQVCDACGGIITDAPHECRAPDRRPDVPRSSLDAEIDQAAAASNAGRIASSE